MEFHEERVFVDLFMQMAIQVYCWFCKNPSVVAGGLMKLLSEVYLRSLHLLNFILIDMSS